MDFRFTPEEEAWREEVRQFLRENPPESFPIELEDAGFGSGAVSKEFMRAVGSKGWISRFWPKEYGGEGRSMTELLIRKEEFAYAHAPAHALGMPETVARGIIRMGNDFLKKDILPKIAKGELSFSLGFSEPEAGSDLLALQTSAREDGDYYIINGQKIWNSNAWHSDYIYLLTRTDPNVPRHRGLSVFLVDRNLPGITLSPLKSLDGTLYHCQTFLDDVRVHKNFMLGEKNSGFYLMLAGLEYDRFWDRINKAPWCKKILEQIIEYAKETRYGDVTLAKNPLLRHRLAEIAVEIEANRMVFYRAGWMLENELPISYEVAIGKVFADEMGQRLFSLGLQIMGLYPRLYEDAKWDSLRKKLIHWYHFGVGHTLAGGTSEIMRNTIATRGLGLPQN